jgi:PASTA domain
VPERWERDLESLRTVTAPRYTRARIDEGPHGEGMPPSPRRGQRIVVVVVAFAVFGAAAAFVAATFRRQTPSTPVAPDPATAVMVHLSSDDGPSARLEFETQTAEPQVGSYCWAEGASTACADTSLTPFEPERFVTVPSGTPVVVDGDPALDGSVVTIARGTDPSEVILGHELARPITDIEDPDGRYILIVRGSWPQGEVEFFFPIEIVASTSSTPSREVSVLTASLEAPSDGSMPGLVITYRGSTHTFFAQDGRWPGVDLFPMPLQLFDASIDPGTTIAIESDAGRVDGRLFIADRDQRETGESIPLDLSSGTTSLPDDPGYYRLTLVGTWPRGSAGFSVGITIGTPPSDWPPAASVATVPDVVGLTQSQAVARLTDAGFVSVSVASPAGQTGGVVSAQDPAPGTQTYVTTTIRVTVSASG